MYIPQLGLTYPDIPDAHIVQVRQVADACVDEKYPFLDTSPGFRVKSAVLQFIISTLVFFVQTIRFSLKIEGRKNLSKYKHLLKNGAITISNHVFRWDFLCVMQAFKYRRLYFPLWARQLTGKDRHLVRWAGGIPVPETISAMRAFNAAFDTLHEKKQWIHVFPESSRWDYYPYIRPFKKGAFTMAYKYNLPIIPMAFSYREPKGLYRLFKYPLITLRIGDPILPDISKPRKASVQQIRAATHQKITELAGITGNPWIAEGD